MDNTSKGAAPSKAALYQSLSQTCSKLHEIMNNPLMGITIKAVQLSDTRLVERTIAIEAETFPAELHSIHTVFLSQIYDILQAKRLQLEGSLHLLRVGSQVVELEDFLDLYSKQYADVEIPIIDGTDISLVKKLLPGQSSTIKINGEFVGVQRIS